MSRNLVLGYILDDVFSDGSFSNFNNSTNFVFDSWYFYVPVSVVFVLTLRIVVCICIFLLSFILCQKSPKHPKHDILMASQQMEDGVFRYGPPTQKDYGTIEIEIPLFSHNYIVEEVEVQSKVSRRGKVFENIRSLNQLLHGPGIYSNMAGRYGVLACQNERINQEFADLNGLLDNSRE